MDVLVPLSNIFDDRKTVTEDNNKHNSISFEEESGSLNDTVVEKKLQKRNLKHRSPEDDEHSVLRLKESDKKTITKPRRNLRKYDLTLYEGGLNECNQCKLKTPRKGDLNKHVQSKHEGVHYSCNKCEYKATQRGSLKIYIEAKHQEPHYSCDQCEYKVLETKIGLKLHVKSVHAEQHYSCDQCEYKATQKRSLKTHVASIHEESCSLNDTVVQTNVQVTYSEMIAKIQNTNFIIVEPDKLECKICQHRLTNEMSMKRHITTKHIKDTSVKEPLQISNDEIKFDLNYVLNVVCKAVAIPVQLMCV